MKRFSCLCIYFFVLLSALMSQSVLAESMSSVVNASNPVFVSSSSSGGMSLAPPPTDVSVQFLGNLFGTVDGVLHGTGSQIMGSMFSIFNSAVLALGGIIIMYTLIVSTMNTAQEGQFLGQKFSSIWVPVRSTAGLALLLPKASGYCMMQIFTMWIIVQGVGAADKVWNGALDYLNRGGVIIKAQMNTSSVFMGNNNPAMDIAKGANAILAGQVCMIAVKNQLVNAKKELERQNNLDGGATCKRAENTALCNNNIPDLTATFSATAVQSNSTTQGVPLQVPMPNFPSSSPFTGLNGICGQVTFNAVNIPNLNNFNTLSGDDKSVVLLTRAMAVQQLYQSLLPVAQVMINNDPKLIVASLSNAQQGSPVVVGHAATWAKNPFGVPNCGANECVWEKPSGTNLSPLFSGMEIWNAINDYNAVMAPTLNLIANAQDTSNFNNERAFINQSKQSGWILAGSYFFDIVRLNGNALAGADTVDTNSGMGASEGQNSGESLRNVCQPYFANANAIGSPNNAPQTYCYWLSIGQPAVPFSDNLADLIGIRETNGATMIGNDFPTDNPDYKTVTASTTVNAFVYNALQMKTMPQQGVGALDFAKTITITPTSNPINLPAMSFPCGGILGVCIGQLMGTVFYNLIAVTLLNFFVTFFGKIVETILMMLLYAPLKAMSVVFTQGVAILSQPGVNPILALANMGAMYINFVGQTFTSFVLYAAAMTLFLPIVLTLVMLIAPLMMAWISVMLSVGFVTAYYVPMVPYMIFLFGAFAWFMLVIEAMVAAPIVALGITHPEGHEAFGKSEQALNLLISIFLRPPLMIIGFVAGISLSYVGVWMLNAGFDRAVNFIQDPNAPDVFSGGGTKGWENWAKTQGENWSLDNQKQNFNAYASDQSSKFSSWGDFGSNAAFLSAPLTGSKSTSLNYNQSNWSANYSGGGYDGWAGIVAFIFSVTIYTSLYLTLVQKAFGLIAILPDKVMRWIGHQESAGQEALGWTEETKGKVQEVGKETVSGIAAVGKKAGSMAAKAVDGGATGGTSISGGKG